MNELAKLFDPDNMDNITLYDETGDGVEFEQIAVIVLDGNTYVMLHPVFEDGDVAYVFEYHQVEDEWILALCDDDDIIDRVFDEYNRMA